MIFVISSPTVHIRNSVNVAELELLIRVITSSNLLLCLLHVQRFVVSTMKQYRFQGKTMIGQNVLLELVPGDKVQIYAYTATGLTDHKSSRYTQFIGILLRPSVEAMHEVMVTSFEVFIFVLFIYHVLEFTSRDMGRVLFYV